MPKALHERSLVFLEQIRQDLRHGVRQLARNRGFSSVVILSLALGIGANVAVFTAIDSLLFKSLPVSGPGELVQLDSENRQQVNTLRGFSFPGFEILKAASSGVLSGMFAYTSADSSSSVNPVLASSNIVYRGHPGIAKGMLASANMYSVLGVKPVIGRLLVPEDDRAEGSSPVVVLSYAYWQSRFHSDPALLGNAIVVNRVPLTVVGVTPPEFRGVELAYSPDFTAPLSMASALKVGTLKDGAAWWLSILGRKKAGISNRQVETALSRPFRVAVNDMLQSMPASMAPDIQKMVSGLTLKVTSANRGATVMARDEVARSLTYLMVIVTVVFAIACLNLANLISARTASRHSEIRVRMSLGASRMRVFRQFLAEMFVLAVLGEIVGITVAEWGGRVVLLMFADPSLASSLNVSPDPRIIAFGFAAAIVCTICLGIAPLIQIAAARLHETVREGRSQLRSKIPDALILIQVAFALLLTVSAGLLVRSFQKIRTIDPGFRPAGVLAFTVSPSSAGYSESSLKNFVDNLSQQISRIPDVLSVSTAKFRPGEIGMGTFVSNTGGTNERGRDPVSVNLIDPKYFATVGMELIGGRSFTDHDRQPGPSVAVVNQNFAHRYFGNQNPIGKTFTFLGDDRTPIQVVGLVGDVKEHGLLAAVPATVYVPFRAAEGDIVCLIRTRSDPRQIIPTVRLALNRIDPLLPLSDVSTLSVQLDASISREHTLADLSTVIGVLALALAAVGLYGVFAYTVTREGRALGVRMALGAQPSTILWHVFRRVLILASGGVGIGVLLTFGLGRGIASLLYGLTPRDPLSIAAAALILMLTCLLAAYFPARRAAHIDPALVLRQE